MEKDKQRQVNNMRCGHYWRRYKITPRIYDNLLAKQNGCCAVCGGHYTQFDRYLDVDENPISHLPRGLLCIGCNRNVGKYENLWLKDEKLIRKIEKYLAKYDVGYYSLCR